ncbi:MAG: GNAT family protein [Pseudomonadota bacterium]
MDLNAPGLASALIRLDPLSEDHREALRRTEAVEHMWISMPAIQRGAGFDVYFDYMLRSAAQNEAYPLAILDPNDHDRFIGVTAFLDPSKLHRRVRLGYTWIDPHLRGRGLFDAVKTEMIKRAIDWGARRIEWQIEAPNSRALSAIERLGAQQEGLLRQHTKLADGTWVDVIVLSLLREEAKALISDRAAVSMGARHGG